MDGPRNPGLTSGSDWPHGTLMSRLDPDTAADLLRLAAGQEYKPGTVLIHAGGRDNHVYLLRSARRARSACVKVTATSESGIETILGIRAGGDIVGELAMLGLGTRSATVKTCSQLIAHKIPADVFMEFLTRRPQAWGAIALMIAERLQWANMRRVDHAGHSSTVQIARVITEILELYGYRTPDGLEELGVSLSQPELGTLVGASKDAAIKAIKELRDMGYLETGYRRITVVNSVNLRAFAGLPVLAISDRDVTLGISFRTCPWGQADHHELLRFQSCRSCIFTRFASYVLTILKNIRGLTLGLIT